MRPVCPDALSSSRRCCSHTRRPSSDEHSEILCRRCSSYSPGIFWRGLLLGPKARAIWHVLPHSGGASPRERSYASSPRHLLHAPASSTGLRLPCSRPKRRLFPVASTPLVGVPRP